MTVDRRLAPRHSTRLVLVGGAALIVSGVGVFIAGCNGPRAIASPPTMGVTTTHPMPHPVGLRASRPTQLSIPSLGITTGLESLGLHRDGTVEVPQSTDAVGWYRGGPTPGQIGSSVLLGHVDSYRGPGVFFELRTMKRGQQISISLADHVVVHFSVTSVQTFPKAAFPSNLVYANHGYAALQLVTCGGVFNQATGSYESNVVVFTRMVTSSSS